MKKSFKIKKKIYRKYFGDIWGNVILKGQITRTFKYLLEVFRIKIVKTFFFKKKKYLRIRKMYMFKKKFKYKNYKPGKKKFKFLLSVMHSPLNISSNNDRLTAWKNNFWFYFKHNYFNTYSSLKKKKHTRSNYLFVLRKTIRFKVYKANYLKKVLDSRKTVDPFKKWKKPLNFSDEKFKTFIDDQRRFYNHISFLEVKHSYIKKKFKNWWYLRITQKRAAIFYGIFNLKKFRYFQNLSHKAMSLNIFYALKLELMVNIILFKLNIFNNIYFSNNFIKLNGILVNKKKIVYPLKMIKKDDVIAIQQIHFKKIFNLFSLKLYHNKNFVLKKAKKIQNWELAEKYFLLNFLRNPRIAINYPPYFVVNYKILHAILWRFPKRKEISSSYVAPGSNTYDWNFSTQLSYN